MTRLVALAFFACSLAGCADAEVPVGAAHPANPSLTAAPTPRPALGVLGSAFDPDALAPTPTGSANTHDHSHHHHGHAN